MPENLTMGFFAFGAVLILISLLGGGFNIFSFAVSTTVSSPVIRITAFILGTAFILLALNPGMVPIPQPDPINTPLPVVAENPTSVPPPDQTSAPPAPPSPQPTVVTDTPIPIIPSPVEFVVSYWQNVNDGKFESAWAQLSPGFRQAKHNNDYNDYVYGYRQMNLCRIEISNLQLVRQDGYSAVVTAHFTYYTGAQCNSSEYDFEMRLVYDGASNSWLLDRNIVG